jgi:hypothetical protein
LHDIVAHRGVQAGAARVVITRDPVKAKQALVSIEGSSRQAVLELHRLLGFLRQEGDADDLAPQPGLNQLDSLAASMHGSRLSVAISVEGERSRRPSTSRPTGSCRALDSTRNGSGRPWGGWRQANCGPSTRRSG